MDHKDFNAWLNRSHFDAIDREGDDFPHPDDREEADYWNEHFRQNHK